MTLDNAMALIAAVTLGGACVVGAAMSGMAMWRGERRAMETSPVPDAPETQADLFGQEGEPSMPKYTKTQARHDAPAREFLAMLAAAENGRMRSTEIKTDIGVRNVCRNRNFARTWGRGMGATWMITDAGRAFLATVPVSSTPGPVDAEPASESLPSKLPEAA